MTAETVTLLPPNATVLERALESVSAQPWAALDDGMIARSKDPATCPEHLLDFLAFEHSVDAWDDGWPVERKRWAIGNAIRMHRIKGTRQGIADHLRLAGARLVTAAVPPGKSFLGARRSDADRRKFLSRYPQLRIYPFVERTGQASGVFLSANSRTRFFSRMFPESTRALGRYRREARLFDPATGEETVLTRRVVTRADAYAGTVYAHEEVLLPAKRRGIHIGAPPESRRFFCVSDAPERRFSLAVGRPYQAAIGKTQYVTALPSLDPINRVPELTLTPGPRHGGSFAGAAPTQRRFLVASRAWSRVDERFWLLDRRRPIGDMRTRRTSYLGASRFGMPPHHAELKIAVRGRRSRRAFGRYMHGFMLAHDRAPLSAALDAVRASKRLSDRILIDTVTRRAARAGDPLSIAEHRLGQFVKD